MLSLCSFYTCRNKFRELKWLFLVWRVSGHPTQCESYEGWMALWWWGCYCCCNTLSLTLLETTHLLSYSSVGHKFSAGLTAITWRSWEAVFLSGALGKNISYYSCCRQNVIFHGCRAEVLCFLFRCCCCWLSTKGHSSHPPSSSNPGLVLFLSHFFASIICLSFVFLRTVWLVWTPLGNGGQSFHLEVFISSASHFQHIHRIPELSHGHLWEAAILFTAGGKEEARGLESRGLLQYGVFKWDTMPSKGDLEQITS